MKLSVIRFIHLDMNLPLELEQNFGKVHQRVPSLIGTFQLSDPLTQSMYRFKC
jgi:hypothetical protein